MTNQTTTIYNESTFYPAFKKDILKAKKEVIIYSPFISKYRADFFRKTFIRLRIKNIKLTIFTRPIDEHEEYAREEAKTAIKLYESLGARVVFLKGSIHEKVAVIDKKILWIGSMNILSQRSSKELMTRVEDEDFTAQVISRLDLDRNLRPKTGTGTSILGLVIKSMFSGLFAIIRWVMVILIQSILSVFNIISFILG